MALERNVRVKVRLSVLEKLIGYKGDLSNRGGRELSSHKVVVDSPVLEFTDLEYDQRKADLAKVINYGWELQTQAPCICWTGDITVDPVTAIVTMTGKVRSNNVATVCGFYIDDAPDWVGAIIQAATESPITSLVDEKFTATYDFSLFRGMTFYIQAYCADANKSMYALIKSIEIPPLP